MARYHKTSSVTKSNYPIKYEKVWKIGEKPEYPGIYECQECGFEDVINRDCDKLPPCANCNDGKSKTNTWQLLVLAQSVN